MSTTTHYEMLWDCVYCGTKRLFGKKHRFCPNCGAKQEPTSRYFPDKEGDTPLLPDYKYVGEDFVCPSCGSAISANVANCTSCGDELDSAKRVNLIQAPPANIPASENPPKKLPLTKIALIILIISAIGFWIYAGIKDEQADISSYTWNAYTHYEQFQRVSESNWASSVPYGAFNKSCQTKQRTTKQVPDGYTTESIPKKCASVRKDNGDGSYKVTEHCTGGGTRQVPRYKSVPVYDNYCNYQIDKWVSQSPLMTTGTPNENLLYAPIPEPNNCSALGCYRLTRNSVDYFALLTTNKEQEKCKISAQIFSALPNKVWVRTVLSEIDCTAIKLLTDK